MDTRRIASTDKALKSTFASGKKVSKSVRTRRNANGLQTVKSVADAQTIQIVDPLSQTNQPAQPNKVCLRAIVETKNALLLAFINYEWESTFAGRCSRRYSTSVSGKSLGTRGKVRRCDQFLTKNIIENRQRAALKPRLLSCRVNLHCSHAAH